MEASHCKRCRLIETECSGISTRQQQREEEKVVTGVDRISNLPYSLIHKILFLLNTKDAVRTSVLSHRWASIWTTFPVLDQNESRYLHLPITLRRERFREGLLLSMVRRDVKNLLIMRIQAVRFISNELDPLLYQLVNLGIRGSLKVLELIILTPKHYIKGNSHCSFCYVLPDEILSLGFNLECLSVESCSFMPNNVINFQSLKKLHLTRVHIREQLLSDILDRCPKIETLKIKHCRNLGRVRIVNHRLETLSIKCCRHLEWFEMDVPNLMSFKFQSLYAPNDIHNVEIRGFRACNATSFCSLKTLLLTNAMMRMELFEHMISSFPNLENLTLKFCKITSHPRVISEKLKVFVVEDSEFEDQVDILTPNLECWSYTMRIVSQTFSLSTKVTYRPLTTFLLEGKITLPDEQLQSLLSNCPLKDLTLRGCSGFKHLNIFSENLERLVVEDCNDLVDGDFHAPSLVYFKYVGPILLFSRVHISDQLHLELHFHSFSFHCFINYCKHLCVLRDVFRTFNQARLITIDCDLFGKFNYNGNAAAITNKISRSRQLLYYLKCVEVRTSSRDNSFIDLFCGAFSLSFCCTGLLFLNCDSTSIKLKFRYPREIEAESSSSNSESRPTHNCIIEHLMEVEIENFKGKEDEMQMVQFLLGEALLLKKISVIFDKQFCKEAFFKCLDAMATIRSFWKASSNVEVVYTHYF